MKSLFTILFVASLAVLSCKDDTADLQRIDQVADIYIDSLGQDMLNANIPGSYITIGLNDVYGDVDNAPVSFEVKKNEDTLSYIQYISGAKRRPIGNSTTLYESKIAVNLVKKVNDTLRTSNDTMIIRYDNSPEVFQINSVIYNGTTVFTKIPGQPNRIKVVK